MPRVPKMKQGQQVQGQSFSGMSTPDLAGAEGLQKFGAGVGQMGTALATFDKQNASARRTIEGKKAAAKADLIAEETKNQVLTMTAEDGIREDGENLVPVFNDMYQERVDKEIGRDQFSSDLSYENYTAIREQTQAQYQKGLFAEQRKRGFAKGLNDYTETRNLKMGQIRTKPENALQYIQEMQDLNKENPWQLPPNEIQKLDKEQAASGAMMAIEGFMDRAESGEDRLGYKKARNAIDNIFTNQFSPEVKIQLRDRIDSEEYKTANRKFQAGERMFRQNERILKEQTREYTKDVIKKMSEAKEQATYEKIRVGLNKDVLDNKLSVSGWDNLHSEVDDYQKATSQRALDGFSQEINHPLRSGNWAYYEGKVAMQTGKTLTAADAAAAYKMIDIKKKAEASSPAAKMRVKLADKVFQTLRPKGPLGNFLSPAHQVESRQIMGELSRAMTTNPEADYFDTMMTSIRKVQGTKTKADFITTNRMIPKTTDELRKVIKIQQRNLKNKVITQEQYNQFLVEANEMKTELQIKEGLIDDPIKFIRRPKGQEEPEFQ